MSGDTVSVSLTYPIEVDGRTVSSLTLRRPLVKDMIAAERQPGAIGQEAAMIAACSGVPFKAVGRLDASDYRAVTLRSELAFASTPDDQRRILIEAGLGFMLVPDGAPDPSAGPASPEASGSPSSPSTDGPVGTSPTASS